MPASSDGTAVVALDAPELLEPESLPGRRRALPRSARAGRDAPLRMMSANCSGSMSRPRVLMVSWNCWPWRDRLLADLPGRHLDVLLGDGGDHVHGAEVQRRQLVGIEPGADAVVALAEVGDAGDAGQPAQFVLDVDRGVVAEERGRRSGRPARSG